MRKLCCLNLNRGLSVATLCHSQILPISLELNLTILFDILGLLVNGLTNVSIPDIEKEFGFSSSKAGLILSSNDIAGIILVPIVSFLGTHGKKPKWIGYGAILTGEKTFEILFLSPRTVDN